ncbi:hypothetical protein HYC85_018061 [Camellia sinensis]|uniref:Uncharacterized protein n=1 Tax=Camellia sinensis TaxID=4442 RepID=A0A7J7GWX6_CAMSI|nr:hypothetical protein HYC85_018061 [Camellia sinensis]
MPRAWGVFPSRSQKFVITIVNLENTLKTVSVIMAMSASEEFPTHTRKLAHACVFRNLGFEAKGSNSEASSSLNIWDPQKVRQGGISQGKYAQQFIAGMVH